MLGNKERSYDRLRGVLRSWVYIVLQTMRSNQFFYVASSIKMLSWLFGAPQEKVTIQIIPEGAAKSLPGFHNGGLTLIATKGTTFGKLMDNFNAYRGPDSQIQKLFGQDGTEIPFSTVITAPVVAYVKKV